MKQVFYWSLVAALAGLLFGFDTVVISGADKKLQTLWNSSDGFHGAVVMAMALWGTVAGAIFGGFPTQRFGRKQTLSGIGILYTLSAVGSALANEYTFFGPFSQAYLEAAAPDYKIGVNAGLKMGDLSINLAYTLFSEVLIQDFQWVDSPATTAE